MAVDPAALADAVTRGDRTSLGQAITLVESRRAEDEAAGDAVLVALHGRGLDSTRVGISGPPGVGKSTLIDALGSWLCARGHKVAVLAVDPSSARTGGSILGDKTRMARLSRAADAFVRPSPSAGALGGVAPRTREAIAVCEGAGYDVILVETMGVGQSETAVAGMVDFVLLLVQPDSGDELQGMKRGITEIADAVFVNKADGERRASANRTRAEYEQALGLLHGAGRTVPVLAGAAVADEGIESIWQAVCAHPVVALAENKRERRRQQGRTWLEEALHDSLVTRFLRQPAATTRLQSAYAEVDAGATPPRVAARRLLHPHP
ncbi:MAG: methylmalonyl Co-A mutase-associated GTPase MeaB [Planctomycetota bacterium]